MDEKILKDLTKHGDDAIFEAFEQHGYSKAWLMDPRNTERVTVCELEVENGIVKTFFVDEVALFNMYQHMEIEVDPVLGPIGSKMVFSVVSCLRDKEK